MTSATTLRLAALAIAALAVVDPRLSRSRSSRPFVAIVTTDSARDRALASRVERELARDFTVVRGPIAASGTVLVGDALPDEARQWGAPLVAVLPSGTTPSVRIVSLDAPTTAPRDTRLPVDVQVVARGGRGRQIDVELWAGELRVDRRRADVTADSVTLHIPLAHVPEAAGTIPLRVTASMDVSSDDASTVVDVRDHRYDVLVFDARPSWASTFVRRALESDQRFAVANRVVTSRGLSNTAGAAPASLRDERALSAYATIVVGSPDQLTAGDISGLDGFMRQRGGRVVLLMDRRAAGPVDRLTGVATWRAVRLPAAANLGANGDTAALRAQEIAWPEDLPVGATAHVVAMGRDSSVRNVVWSIPVGAGRLLVSGALDAWYYRDRATSGFDRFWTNLIAAMSADALPPISVEIVRRSIAPGQVTAIRAYVRDAALDSRSSDRTASISATLAGTDDSTMVRLWPDATAGTFTGTVVAPSQPGVYRLVVSSGSDRGSATLTVDSLSRVASRADSAGVAAFVSSRGGTVFRDSDLRHLSAQLSAAFQAVSRVESWHPMRSPWWIVPFALLLGAEWWARRRRGLA